MRTRLSWKKNKETYEKKLSVLDEVPCGPDCGLRKYIKDAYELKELLQEETKTLTGS